MQYGGEHSISEHILKMSGYHNHLTQLGVNLPYHSVIDRVLQSLPPSYKGFVMNYNMQGMNTTITELFAMLKAAEVEIKKEHQVLMVNKTTSFKKKGKGKKGNFKKNDKQVVAQVKKPKSGCKPETECFYYKGTGHWKRNCPKYLADKKDGKVNVYLIYMLLMCTLLMLVVAPGYLILVLLLIFATRNRGYGLSEDWLRTR